MILSNIEERTDNSCVHTTQNKKLVDDESNNIKDMSNTDILNNNFTPISNTGVRNNNSTSVSNAVVKPTYAQIAKKGIQS